MLAPGLSMNLLAKYCEKNIRPNLLLFMLGACGRPDLYENPVKVQAEELYELALQRWQECLNAWLIEYEQLNQKR
jgi:hypothetical protein